VSAAAREAVEMTYGRDIMVQKLEEGCDVGKLEDGDQATLVALELVLDYSQEGGEQVCGDQASEANESLLADSDPWRVAHTKEDGLADVSVVELMMELMTYVIVFLAVFGKKSGGGRHRENRNECVILGKNAAVNQNLRT
jgi:hypothetical protein